MSKISKMMKMDKDSEQNSVYCNTVEKIQVKTSQNLELEEKKQKFQLYTLKRWIMTSEM